MKKTNSCTHYIENHKAQFNKYWCENVALLIGYY